MVLSKKDKAYFNIAKEISKLSDFPRIHIGCVAVYKHRVIATGMNSQKTNPLQKKYNRFRFDDDAKPHCIHSEVACLTSLIGNPRIDFKNVSLYIYRENGKNELALARPCNACMKLIMDLGIRHIYYTNTCGFSHEKIFDKE